MATKDQVGLHRKALRVRLGVRSQGALAAAAGVHLDTVNRAEQGEDVMASTLASLANALGVTLDDYAYPPAEVAPSPAGVAS